MKQKNERPGISLVMTLMLVLAVCSVPPPAQAVTLGWTAVGDDGNTGSAAGYVMVWSLDSAAIHTWDCDPGWCDPSGTVTVELIPANMLPADRPSGTRLTVDFPDSIFPSGATIFITVKAFDEADNWGQLGNIARKVIPDTVRPAAIMDLF